MNFGLSLRALQQYLIIRTIINIRPRLCYVLPSSEFIFWSRVGASPIFYISFFSNKRTLNSNLLWVKCFIWVVTTCSSFSSLRRHVRGETLAAKNQYQKSHRSSRKRNFAGNQFTDSVHISSSDGFSAGNAPESSSGGFRPRCLVEGSGRGI